MKLLLFGAAGLIGLEMERACVERDIEFIGLKRSDVDVTDFISLRASIAQHLPAYVVNAVALKGIDPSERDPELAFSVHAEAAREMAIACAEIKSVYVHASTNAVFDGRKDTPYTEEDVPQPCNVYGASKLSGEEMARTHCPNHTIVRFPILYGNRKNQSPRFVDSMIEALKGDKPLRVADDKFDSFTYAKDAATGVLDLLKSERPHGLYHVTNSGHVSYFDFVSKLKSLLDSKSPLERVRDSDFPSLGEKPLCSSLASIRLNPMRDWTSALEAYVNTLES